MTSLTIFVSLAVGFVWMQRNHRWAVFWGAAEGHYKIKRATSTKSAFSTSGLQQLEKVGLTLSGPGQVLKGIFG